MTAVVYLIVAILVVFIDGWAPTRSIEEGVFRLGIGRVYLMEWLIYGLLVAFVLDWLLGSDASKRRENLFEQTVLDKPIQRFALLLPAFAVYGLMRGNPLQRAVGYYEWRSLFVAIVFYFLLVSILNTPAKAARLFYWFLALCTIKAGYYLFFYFFSIPYPFEKVIGAGTIDEGPENVMFVFAGLPAISLWLFRNKRRTSLEKLARLTAMLVTANLMISAKRTIQLGFLLGLVILFLRIPWRRLVRPLAVAAGTVALLALVLSVVNEKADDSRISASVSRYSEISSFLSGGELIALTPGDTLAFHLLDYWDAWEQIKQHPILGSGFGSEYGRWYTVLPGVGGEDAGFDTGMVHSLYLDIWWKMGIPGLLIFGALIVAYFKYVGRVCPRLPLSEYQVIALGFYAAVWAELSMDFWGAQWIGSTKDPLIILMAIALTVCLLRETVSPGPLNQVEPEWSPT